MNNFVYDMPIKVYFGKDQLNGNLSKELAKYGKKVLLAYGGGSIKSGGLYDKLIAEMKTTSLEVYELSGIEPNPRVESVKAGVDICEENNIDVILAVGGGSVVDCSKHIAAASFYDGDAWDISLGKVDVEKCLPIITITTLAATGSDMNCNAVISNVQTKEKLVSAFQCMLPKVSFLDPTLTYSVSKYQTASGAADILSHIMEVYFNMNEDFYMLDSIMESLMKTVIKYAPIALQDPNNYEARANLMWVSSWAINGFIESGKTQAWSCHAMEHELSAFYDIAHGHGLAILTPRWLEYCLDETTVSKFYQFGVNVFNIDHSMPQMDVAKKAIEMFSDFLFKTCELKSTLTDINIDDTYFDIMSKKAIPNGRKEAFKTLTPNDVLNIFKMCL